MTSASFVINVSTDLGLGKTNIGIRFPQPPSSLETILQAINECISQEKRDLLKDPNASFSCVFTLINNNQAARSEKEKWIELSDISQIRNNVQLYVFDTQSPPPERGIVPKPKKIVDVEDLLHSTGRTSTTSTSRDVYSRAGTESYDSPQRVKTNTFHYTSQEKIPSRTSASRTSKSSQGEAGHIPSASDESFNRTDTGFTSSTYHTDLRGSFTGNAGARGSSVGNVDRARAREYLYEQLCRRTATSSDASTRSFISNHTNSRGYADNGQFITAQMLHNVLIQNDMFFPTEVFTEMTGNKEVIDHNDWQDLVEGFTPVIDVLYDRIASKSQGRGDADSTMHKTQSIKSSLDALAEEEAALLARQATIKEERARLKRQLAELESKDTSDKDNRSKEWDILNKFVNLKLKQTKLKNEERAVSHQLSLL